MATSCDALGHLVNVCREVTQGRDHYLGDAIESAAVLGAGETLYVEIEQLLCQPEHCLPPSVVRAWSEANDARRRVGIGGLPHDPV